MCAASRDGDGRGSIAVDAAPDRRRPHARGLRGAVRVRGDAGRRRRAHDVLGAASRRAGLVPRAGPGGRARAARRLRRQPLGRPAGSGAGRPDAACSARISTPSAAAAATTARSVFSARSRSSACVKDAGLELPVALEAVDFTDEEGTLIGLLGSWAMAGILTKEILGAPRGGRELLVSELERMGLTEDGLLAARRDPETLAGYLELHIEQGPGARTCRRRHRRRHGDHRLGFVQRRLRGRGASRRHDPDGRAPRRGSRRRGVRPRRAGDGRHGLPRLRRHGREHRDGAGLVQRRPGPGAAADGVPLARQRRAGRARAGAHRPRARRGGALRPRRHGRPARALGAGADRRGGSRLRSSTQPRSWSFSSHADALRGWARRTGARGDHAERDGVRSLRRRHQPRSLRAHALGGLRQRRQRASQRDRRSSPAPHG